MPIKRRFKDKYAGSPPEWADIWASEQPNEQMSGLMSGQMSKQAGNEWVVKWAAGKWADEQANEIQGVLCVYVPKKTHSLSALPLPPLPPSLSLSLSLSLFFLLFLSFSLALRCFKMCGQAIPQNYELDAQWVKTAWNWRVDYVNKNFVSMSSKASELASK